MTHRERVLNALNFQDIDRIPMDLGGMDSTGISAFAYPRLVEALHLPPRIPYVHDTGQMLALPEMDVLDALDIDVISVRIGFSNMHLIEEEWDYFDFGGRLPARVRDAGLFEVLDDGTVIQPQHGLKMPNHSFVFDSEHGGHPVDVQGELPPLDLARIKDELERRRLSDEDILETEKICKEVFEKTDRAVFLNGPMLGIGIGNYGGIGVFPLYCLLEPEKVKQLHEIHLNYALSELERLLPRVAPYVHIYMCNSDDWGTQNNLIASPEVFRDLFLPYYREFNRYIHWVAPGVKTFFHSCGAIFDLIDSIIEAEFDILNPVQWTAGGHSYVDWKRKAEGRLVLWGGGINTQSTLPLGGRLTVRKEVEHIVQTMGQHSGYVFCAIHNILAEVPVDNVIEMYRTAREVNLSGSV